MSKPKVSESRRKFLRDAGISSGVALAAATAPAAALAENPDEGATARDKPEQGYRLTKHILDYYKSVAD